MPYSIVEMTNYASFFTTVSAIEIEGTFAPLSAFKARIVFRKACFTSFFKQCCFFFKYSGPASILAVKVLCTCIYAENTGPYLIFWHSLILLVPSVLSVCFWNSLQTREKLNKFFVAHGLPTVYEVHFWYFLSHNLFYTNLHWQRVIYGHYKLYCSVRFVIRISVRDIFSTKIAKFVEFWRGLP